MYKNSTLWLTLQLTIRQQCLNMLSANFYHQARRKHIYQIYIRDTCDLLMDIPWAGKKRHHAPLIRHMIFWFISWAWVLTWCFFSKDLLGEISHESTEIHPLLGQLSECFQIPYINTSIEFVTDITALCQKVCNKMLAGYQTTNPLGLA